MAWIESHQSLRDHPKLLSLASLLGVPPVQAVGHLHYLWWWCIDYALDGVIRYDACTISRASGWEGKPEVFLDALLHTGFVTRSRGKYHVHDWHDYAGALVIKRLQRRARQPHGSRTAPKRQDVGEARRPTNQPTNHNQPTNQPKDTPLPPKGGGGDEIPERLSTTAGFSSAWDEWQEYRRERRKTLTATSRRKQLKFLALQGDPVAVIEQSIRNGWEGLFELKGTGHGRQQQSFTPADIERIARRNTAAGP